MPTDPTDPEALAAAWLDDALPPDDEWDGADDAPLAATDGVVLCPYCGEENEVALDPGSGAAQEYVEDCQVCCQPWRVVVAYDADGSAHVHATPADGE